MPKPESEFQRAQRAFIAHVRAPDRNQAPADVAPARMRLYRELFINNIESFLASGFPVLKSILEGERWQALVDDFFAVHKSRTPLFGGIAEEFLNYLHQDRGENPADPPFLRELAQYEWVELALSIAEPDAPPPHDDSLPALDLHIFLSELAWPLAYRFPVHRIGPGYQPAAEPEHPIFLVVYRDREDLVRFLEINAATYRLLQLVETGGPVPVRECLRRLALELGYPDPEALLGYGAELVSDLARRGVIGVDVSGSGTTAK